MAQVDDTAAFQPETKSPQSGRKEDDPLETAKWTMYLPESFGIREAVRQSSYRWCVREGYVIVCMEVCRETGKSHSHPFWNAVECGVLLLERP